LGPRKFTPSDQGQFPAKALGRRQKPGGRDPRGGATVFFELGPRKGLSSGVLRKRERPRLGKGGRPGIFVRPLRGEQHFAGGALVGEGAGAPPRGLPGRPWEGLAEGGPGRRRSGGEATREEVPGQTGGHFPKMEPEPMTTKGHVGPGLTGFTVTGAGGTTAGAPRVFGTTTAAGPLSGGSSNGLGGQRAGANVGHADEGAV